MEITKQLTESMSLAAFDEWWEGAGWRVRLDAVAKHILGWKLQSTKFSDLDPWESVYDDVDVLFAIQSKPHPTRLAFSYALDRAIQHRAVTKGVSNGVRVEWPYALTLYEPGDYALAGLLAVCCQREVLERGKGKW